MSWEILEGDCVERMAAMDDASIDAIVCDPPYGLEFMGKDWDRLAGTPGYNERGRITDRPDTPASGYVGAGGRGVNSYQAGLPMQEWHQAWATQALRVLKPGGHLLAFGGTRTYHRLACAIEDAGFEIRDSLLWLYGSGFPKSHNGEWGGTALKPSHEPIVVGRKPLEGTVEQNWRKHGTGALNIDACRIKASPDDPGRNNWHQNRENPGEYPVGESIYELGLGPVSTVQNPDGRWPANVVLSPEAAEELDEQSGESKSSGGQIGKTSDQGGTVYEGGWASATKGDPGFGDTGGASRFFYCAKTSRSERNAGLDSFEKKPMHWSSGDQSPGTFQAEGTEKAARNPHPTVKPINLMRWLCRLVTPPGGTVLDPFTGSGTTGCAAVLEGFDFIGVEREAEYVEIARARVEFWEPHAGRELEDVLSAHSASQKAAQFHAEQGQLSIGDFE